MGLIKSLGDNVKRFFRREEKKKSEAFQMKTNLPEQKPAKTLKFRRGFTRQGRPKHPLHRHHFGTFSPMKPVYGIDR